MNADHSLQIDELLTLLAYADRGANVIAIYDRVALRGEIVETLHAQLTRRVFEITMSGRERNPIDLIRARKPEPGDVICLFELERGFPEVLGYLDLQREVLSDLGVSVVCWVNNYEFRELASRAPNFFAFRSATLDFTDPVAIPTMERIFIGREPELAELATLVTQGGVVVVTGYGGVGKTALAQELSRRMRDRFRETVWINCETKPSLEEILLTAGLTLIGEVARQYRAEEREQRVRDVMQTLPALLILDNFETVAEDADLLRWLTTTAAPGTALLISRQRVPALSAPTFTLDQLPTADAIALFEQRARLAGWEGADGGEVSRLCELVGNLPLAIELLAPRAAELPLKTLREMVGKSLDALVSGSDPLRAERHQSIAACFRVSYDRLSETARQMLARLSLLPDGASPEIVGPYTEIADWQEPISECIRHSLLDFDGSRYTLHPLIRRFAETQLGSALRSWQHRLVNFFCDFAKSCYASGNEYQSVYVLREGLNVINAMIVAEHIGDEKSALEISSIINEVFSTRNRQLEWLLLRIAEIKEEKRSLMTDN